MKEEKFDFYSKTAIKSYNLDDKIRYQLKMLDGLDAFTRRHSENVANLTCRLCENLKVDKTIGKGFTIYCTTCAYLHDIGKIFIPPSVLQKNGPLTPDEFKIMKSHTTIGYKMCMEDPKLRPYSAGTLYHHESLDGSGYPNGVKGNEIPYEGQIIRVADEFDAISSKRQYKTHIGVIETLNLLIEDSTPNLNALNTLIQDSKPTDKTKGSVGKINKEVLRQLFKVILDDTEYEIAVRIEYVDFLKEEIKRLKEANRYFDKMNKARENKKDYFKQGAEAYLRDNEKLEECPNLLIEIQKAYEDRQNHIKKLYDEAKQIKNLKC